MVEIDISISQKEVDAVFDSMDKDRSGELSTDELASSLAEIARQPFVVTVEDHSVNTGLGSCLAEALFDHGSALPHLRIGVENYAPSGPSTEVYRHCGLDADSIREKVQAFALARQ